MSVLEQIRVYPVKSLDGTDRSAATIVENGGLEWDRRYAIVEETPAADGTSDPASRRYVNGKREPRIHELSASYDLERGTVSLTTPDSAAEQRFHLDLDRDCLASWLSNYLGYPVEVVREDRGGHPDDVDAAGPTVIAGRTVAELASWYDGIDATEMRRRLRPNLVVGGVPAFWEDRLYDRSDRIVPFDVGSAALEGVNPCQRCTVPTRDPDTGEETPDFRETFLERRAATLPEWATETRFDHYYRIMVNTRVPESSWGTALSVDDHVSIDDPVPAR